MQNVSSSNSQAVNVPKLRFPGFTEEWQVSSFEETFEFLSNNTLSRAELSEDGEIQNIHYGDILTKFGDIVDCSKDELPYVVDKSKLGRKTSYLQNGDIIIADTAEDDAVGKATEVFNIQVPVVSGLHTMACRPRFEFEPRFLGYYINSACYHNQLYPFMQGVKVTSVSKGNIALTEIRYPAKNEQKKIASMVKLIDARIEKQREFIDAIKLYKRGVLSAVFDKKIRFKKADGTDYPEWVSIPFGEIVSEYNDRTKFENEDTLLSAAIDGMYLNTELFGHQRGSSNVGYKKIKKGTLVLSTQNLHLGNANVNMRFEHGMVSPAYKTYHIVGCSAEFMYHWIKREETKQFFFNATTVGASACRRNVEWETLYSQVVDLPSAEEELVIVHYLNGIDNLCKQQEALLINLYDLKKTLLQQMFI